MGVWRVVALSILLGDESALRESFVKEILSKDVQHRVECVKKLSGAKEEKTVQLLAGALKDSALAVRKAAAGAIEASTDGGGVAIKPLGDILVDKSADLDLRLACAKALGKARYKSLAFPYFYMTISTIESEERQFFKFGFDVTQILDKYIGRSFAADKTTAERWSEWWTDNQAELQKTDAKLKEEWKKQQGK